MLIVAHRGGNPEDIENSAEAFRHGLRVGADLLECDLQRAADGEIVVFHDTHFFGTPISSFTTDELKGMIPTLLTLDELLGFLNRLDPMARLVLDLKDRDVDRALAPYLQDRDLAARVIVTSTFSMGLRRLKRRVPRLRTGLSRGATLARVPPRWRPLVARVVAPFMIPAVLVQMRFAGIGTAALQHHLVSNDAVHFFHRRGIRVYAWTVDGPDRARELERRGVDYLTTNVPGTIAPLFSDCGRSRQEEGGSRP